VVSYGGLEAFFAADSHRYIHVLTMEDAMPTGRSRTFKGANSDAVRLPREPAFGPDVSVTIARSGDALTIFPALPPIADMIERLAALPKPETAVSRDETPLADRPNL
jgi:antitoxin VapB